MFLNSKYLNTVNIGDYEPDPFGGSYGRDDIGRVDGTLDGYAAWDFCRRIRSQIPDEVFRTQMAELIQGCYMRGIGSVQTVPMGMTPSQCKGIMDGMGEVPIRIRFLGFPLTIEESETMYDDFGLQSPFNHVQYSGVKWITDGTPQESNMALVDEYNDQPEWFGQLYFDQSDFAEMVRNASSLIGFPRNLHIKENQIEFHAQGDQAIQTILDTMGDVCQYWPLLRPRIIHGDLPDPSQYDQLVSMGICVVKPTSQFIRGEIAFQRLGPERFSYWQPLRSLIEAGVKVALCSDTPGGVPNPFLDLKLAVYHPSNLNESIDMATAIYHHTKMGAYVEFMEYFKGSIAPWQLADIMIPSEDPFDPANFPTMENIYSLLTIVDGQIIWNAGI